MTGLMIRDTAQQFFNRFEEVIPSRFGRYAIGSLGLAGFYFISRKMLSSNRILPSDGKVVVVTGCDYKVAFGSSSARKLHEMGYVVFAGCLDAKNAKENIYNDLKDSKSFHVLQLDVTNQVQVDKAVEIVNEWLAAHPTHRMFGVVNSAGVATMLPFEWHQTDSMVRAFDVNVFGMVRVTKAFLPLIRQAGNGGRIVNVSSLLGEMGSACSSTYCASKAAMLLFSESLSAELVGFGIKVVSVLPDAYRTTIMTQMPDALDKEAAKIKPEIFEAYGGKSRLERMKFFVREILLKTAHADITPVVEAIISGIAKERPNIRIRPADLFPRIVAHLYPAMPETFLNLYKFE